MPNPEVMFIDACIPIVPSSIDPGEIQESAIDQGRSRVGHGSVPEAIAELIKIMPMATVTYNAVTGDMVALGRYPGDETHARHITITGWRAPVPAGEPQAPARFGVPEGDWTMFFNAYMAKRYYRDNQNPDVLLYRLRPTP